MKQNRIWQIAALESSGWRLIHFWHSVHLNFEVRAVVTSLFTRHGNIALDQRAFRLFLAGDFCSVGRSLHLTSLCSSNHQSQVGKAKNHHTHTRSHTLWSLSLCQPLSHSISLSLALLLSKVFLSRSQTLIVQSSVSLQRFDIFPRLQKSLTTMGLCLQGAPR